MHAYTHTHLGVGNTSCAHECRIDIEGRIRDLLPSLGINEFDLDRLLSRLARRHFRRKHTVCITHPHPHPHIHGASVYMYTCIHNVHDLDTYCYVTHLCSRVKSSHDRQEQHVWQDHMHRQRASPFFEGSPGVTRTSNTLHNLHRHTRAASMSVYIWRHIYIYIYIHTHIYMYSASLALPTHCMYCII